MVSDNLLEFASKSYGFNKDTLHFVSDSTNQIYFFQKDSKQYVLRFSNRSAEKINETKAEMEWLYYLADNNIGVGLPLKTVNGELVVSTIENGENYIVTSFETVAGEFWDKNNPLKWNEQIFYNWGKIMGDIHSLTKNFKFTNEQITREIFNGRFALDDNIKCCQSVNKIADNLIDWTVISSKIKNARSKTARYTVLGEEVAAEARA